jgi:hypothetical protein
MHATSTQPMASHGMASKAAVVALIFAAGVALGAIVGTTVASAPAAASVNSVGIDLNAPWFREYRAGERGGAPAAASVNSVGIDLNAPWFREYRAGERGGDETGPNPTH